MIKQSAETSAGNISQAAPGWRSCRTTPLVTALLLLSLSQSLWAQGSKEYIYGPDGKLLASIAAEPTWLQFNAQQGFAGIDTAQVTVGNAAGIVIRLKYQFLAWGNQTPVSYESQVGPLTADGPIPVNGTGQFPIPQNSAPGIITVTAIKNINSSDWIPLAQPATYTIRPPKPVTSTFVSPNVLQLPASSQSQRVHSANMKNQALMISMHLPQGNGDAGYIAPLGAGDPALNDRGGDFYSGRLQCDVLSGDYNFISARNALDSNSDAVVPWGSISSSSIQTLVPCH